MYHGLLGFTFMGYTYLARALYDKNTERRSAIEFMRDVIFGFCKLRVGFATISLLTEFWGAKLSLQKAADGSLSISNNAKRFLLLKETLLNLLWFTSISFETHKKYKVNVAASESANSQLH
jgi:hypothetical protein